MQWLKKESHSVQAALVCLLLGAMAAAPAAARPRPPQTATGSVTVTGTITALNAGAGTLQVTDRNGLMATFKTTTTTVITLDGNTAALASLAVNDPVRVTYDRTTLVASRIVTSSPPPVDLTGTITALNT